MQLEQKYELLEAISDQTSDRDQTIPAWERSTGKQVFVHLLTGGYNTENNLVLSVVGRLSPEHRKHVLGAGDHLGSAYVITDALPWGVSLRQWIASIHPAGETQPPAVDLSHPPAANTPKSETPDPAKLARAGTWRIPAYNPGAKPTPAGPRQPAPPPIPAVSEETKRGPAPLAAERAVTPNWPSAAPASPPVPEKEPGEFTRLMRAGGVDPSAGAAAPVPPSGGPGASPSAPGEFTQMIRAMNADPFATAEMPPPSPAAPAAADNSPGEFTQLLRGYKAGSKPASPASPPAPVQSVTPPPRVAAPPPTMPAKPAFGESPVTPDRAAPSSQPGEFTGWIHQAPAKTPPPAAPPQASWQFDKPGPSVAPGPFDMPGGPAAPSVPPAPPEGPGGFTGMFQAQPQPQSQSPRPPAPVASAPPLSPQAEGEFTRMMRTPLSGGGIFAPPAQGGPADADLFKRPGGSAPVAQGGPSFTQVMAASNAAPPAASVPPPAEKEPEPHKTQSPYLVLGIVLGLLLVLTIALILVLVLRH